MATYENANKYQAECDCLFKVSLPPDEDYNLNRFNSFSKKIFIKGSLPRPGTTDPGLYQCISSRAFNVTKFMLESETDFGIIRIAGTSANLYDTVVKTMIALKACIHKAICGVNDQYPNMIVSVLSKFEVSKPSFKRPNQVDAHGVIIIKHTCNSVQFADDSQTRMIDRGAMCRDMHNVDHMKVEVIHGIGRYHSLYIWISYIFKLSDRKLTKKETTVHKDYEYGIMTKAGISVVGNAFDQLFVLHKKRDVPLAASIAPSIPAFGAVSSSLTQMRATARRWSDLEISQFKEGAIVLL